MSSLAPVHPGNTSTWSPSASWIGRPGRVTLFVLLLIVIAPPAYLSQTGGALTTGYNIQRLQEERNSWRVRNQQLELELAKARSLTWIETEAVNRLGMQRPAKPTVISVDTPPPSPQTRPQSVAQRRDPIAARNRRASARAAEALSWPETLGNQLAELIVGR
jgi:hypothetical protein